MFEDLEKEQPSFYDLVLKQFPLILDKLSLLMVKIVNDTQKRAREEEMIGRILRIKVVDLSNKTIQKIPAFANNLAQGPTEAVQTMMHLMIFDLEEFLDDFFNSYHEIDHQKAMMAN